MFDSGCSGSVFPLAFPPRLTAHEHPHRVIAPLHRRGRRRVGLTGSGCLSPLKIHFQSLFAICAVGILAGCSTYDSQPLDRAAVERSLQAEPIESVKVAAAQISHPLVRPVVIDGRDGFSADEIAVMVVIVSPQLRALRDQRGVAQAQVMQAGILPNPSFSYELDRPGGYPEPLGTQYTWGLSWDVSALLTRHDNVASAKAGAKSLDLSIAWQEWQAAQDARLRAFRILSLEQRLPLARAVEAELADSADLTRKAYEFGEETTADLTAATDAWTNAQNARFDLENQITSERAALNLSLGLRPGEKIRLKAGPAFPELAGGATEATLLQGLEDRRLDLVALRYGYESQDASLRAAVKAQFPKIGLGVVRSRDTSVPPIYTWGPAVTVDIPVFDRNQAQVAAGKATRQQLFDEYVARVSEARSQVGQILASVAIVREQLRAVDGSLPQLERLAASLEDAFKTGDASIQACRDARSALSSRLMGQSELRQQLLELGVALEIATGRPLLNRMQG